MKMQKENNQQQYCSKLIYKDETGMSHCVLGIVIEQSTFLTKFKTRNRELTVGNNHIVSIVPTGQIFEVDSNE